MSKKWIPRFKKPKVVTPVTLPKEPREKADLDKEYTALCSQAGQLQYELKSKGQLLDKLNAQISELIVESNARRTLDQDKEKEITNVQA